ncbi:MAG: alpha/beta hydrolase family protein [Sphingobacteriaceae bacterium]
MDSQKIKLVLFAAFQCCVLAVHAQKQFNVLDWKTDVSLNTYLVQQMHQQYDERRAAFATALSTPRGTEEYIRFVRQKFSTVLGKLPQKADLNPSITGSIQKPGYRIEKIVYQSFQNHHVSSNLYIPEGNGKFPAILLLCGHEDVSKATASYQQTAILLAKNGFVVFVIDPISQSERVQLTDQQGKSLTRGSTTEHTLLNLPSNLLGTSSAAYELFDNVCGLDYLMSRPEVDTEKIGCTGNSGGGMQTIYMAAFDDRIKAFAPCSYLASRERTLEFTGPADGCAQIPGEGAFGLEMSDYLIAAAPKPMLVLAGRYDFIDYHSTRQSFAELKQVYQSLSASNKLSLFTVDDGHGISKPKREAAVQWFRTWFYQDDRPVKEDGLEVLTDQELFAASTGKVSTSYPDEVNIVQENLRRFNELASARAAFAKLPLKERKTQIRELLALNPDPKVLQAEWLTSVNAGTLSFQKMILRRADEVPMPVLLYRPAQKPKKLIICLSDQGKNHLADSAGLMQQYAGQGFAVLLPDVRGTGETTDKLELNDPKFFNKDYRNTLLALHMAKPLLGQKTVDILNLLDFISTQPEWKGVPVEINSQGLVGLAAMHAAFLDQRVSHLNLAQVITTYQDILNNPLAKDRYSVVVNNLLAYYDLPDLAGWIGTARLKIDP